MVNRLYVIFDKVAEESGPIFEAKNDAVAIRNYQNLVFKDNVKHDDYKLLFVGVMDHDNSQIDACTFPEEINTAKVVEVE